MATPEATGIRFEEAIAFLRRRLDLAPGEWPRLLREVDDAARDRSAGMSDALVDDIVREVLEVLETGGDKAAFLDAWDSITDRHGWDDDGKGGALTFRMMTAQAYAAGRWQQIQRLKHIRPFLRYVHVDPELTQRYSRHEHASWHGTILPVDHVWWLTHYPPNGWNCRCYVQSLSARDLDRYGWSVSEEAPPSATVIRIVRGQPVETPRGIDPGFAFNAGIAGLGIAA